VKSGPVPFLVLRDEVTLPKPTDSIRPKPVIATVCFHALVDALPLRTDCIGADAGDRLAIRCFSPTAMTQEAFPWQHENGGLEKTEGLRASITVKEGGGVVYSVLYPGKPPAIAWDAASRTIRVGEAAITFGGDATTSHADPVAVQVSAGGKSAILPAGQVSLDRPQGDIGLFVPDAGYPFGPIPDWLIRQRWKVQDFAPAWAARLRDERP
jgi:hypothetical protein